MDNVVHGVSPSGIARRIVQHRALIMQMVRRDVIGRYRGSVMGILWSFFNPLLMLAVYTFVFGGVFKMRWTGGTGTRSEVALNLFAGMIVHALFAECVNRAPGLIIQNANLVKKVVFPLPILPVMAMGTAVFHAAMSTLVLMIFSAVVHYSVPWTIIFLPVIILPLTAFTLGAAWFLSSLGVYIRDVEQVTGILTTIMMFLSPVFYQASTLAEPYRSLLHLNPLTFAIEQTRAVVIVGIMPDWSWLAAYYVLCFMVAWVGLVWFQKTRTGFADVL